MYLCRIIVKSFFSLGFVSNTILSEQIASFITSCAADRKQTSAVLITFADNAPRTLLTSKEGGVSKNDYNKHSVIKYSKIIS